MDYKDIANRLRKWANGETCEDCPAKDDLAFCAADTIRELLSKVKELEAKNNRLEQARENANAACAKWEGLYRAELEKKAAWVSVRDRLPDNEKPVLAYYGFYREKDDLGARFIGTLTYFSHDPDPHWQHESTGLCVTHWMPLPEAPKEGRSWESQ